MKILFADDEKEITDKYIYHLQRDFKNVYGAYDGMEAYRKYKQLQPDVIILDMYLPKLCGLEILKRIRKVDQKTVIVVLSALSERSTIEEAMASHIYDYVIKPISRGELKEMLGKIENQTKGITSE